MFHSHHYHNGLLKTISGVFSSVIVHHVYIDFGVRVSVLRLKENGPNSLSLTTEAEPTLSVQ
jgi:hypothetical protein